MIDLEENEILSLPYNIDERFFDNKSMHLKKQQIS